MLAKQKWQIKTIAVLERVFKERGHQMDKHGAAMLHLPDGTGPDVDWCSPTRIDEAIHMPATEIQLRLRKEYEEASSDGRLTRMHLVLEELAEAFELDGDDPAFIDEILQVAALCVQWAEYKLDDHGRPAPEGIL